MDPLINGVSTDEPRLDNRCVWIHINDSAGIDTANDLARLICHSGGQVLLSGAPDRVTADNITPLDPSVASDLRNLLSKRKPDIGVVIATRPLARIAQRAAKADIPLYLILTGELSPGRSLVAFRRSRQISMLARYEHCFTLRAKQHKQILELGADENKTTHAGALREAPQGDVLSVNEDERVRVSRGLTGRPVWFAPHTGLNELPALLSAQKYAARAAQGLALILLPAPDVDHRDVCRFCEEAGLGHAPFDLGLLGKRVVQVIIVDDETKAGLWYRIATVAFMGGSLGAGARVNPMDAAALGAAILHGPNTGEHGRAFRILSQAGAARLVTGGETLGRQLAEAITPDVSAQMAHAGWAISTEGAEIVNTVLDKLNERIAQ